MPVTLNFYCLAKYVTSQVLLPQAKTSFGWKPWSSGYGRRLMFESSNPSTGYWMNIFHINLRGKTYCFFLKKDDKEALNGPFKNQFKCHSIISVSSRLLWSMHFGRTTFYSKVCGGFCFVLLCTFIVFLANFQLRKKHFQDGERSALYSLKRLWVCTWISVGANNG